MKRTNFIVMCLLLLFASFLSGCGQADSGTPLPSGFEPPPAVDSAKLVIAFPVAADNADITSRRKDSATYLEGLLRDRGWNITLRQEEMAVDEDTGEYLMQKAVEADLAAGSAADGYVVTAGQAVELLRAGLTKDLSALLPQAVPALCSKSPALLQSPVAGLPLVIPQQPVSRRTLFYLLKEAAKGVQINRVEDIFTFLENHDGARVYCHWSAWSYGSLLTAWAMGQGYYPLDFYGLMNAELYAAYGDWMCSPVPIESIPGFDEFFSRARALWDAGKLFGVNNAEEMPASGVVGYLDIESAHMDIELLQLFQKKGMDYLAFPLAGSATPALKGNASATRQLAVPAANQKASQLALFVQWALTDRSNYDLIQYGAEGKDYRMVGERLEHLDGGQPLKWRDFTDWNPTAYFFTKTFLFWDPAMDRLTVYAPENADALAGSATVVPQPLLDCLQNREISNPNSFFLDVYDRHAQTCMSRSELLNCAVMDPLDGGRIPIGVEESLARLRAMSAETVAVVEDCREKIAEVLVNP